MPTIWEEYRDALNAAQAEQLHNKFEGRKQTRALTVTRVQTDSSGNVETIYGTIDGDPSGVEFPVTMGGQPAREGDVVRVRYDAGATTAPSLEYVGHLRMGRAGAAILDFEASLPAPAFDVSPWTTSLVGTEVAGGAAGVMAAGTITFNGVEERFGPVSYLLSYRNSSTDASGTVTMGPWTDQEVPHIAPPAGTLFVTQTARLNQLLPPGCAVDVKLRTRANWTVKLSEESETRSFIAAVNNTSPGAATALAVSIDTPGILTLKPSGTINPQVFAGWDYEISTTASYTDIITVPPGATPHDTHHPRSMGQNSSLAFGGTPGQDYYVAVKPVSINGIFGTRFPASTWLGPYNVPAAQNLDVTPPPTMLAGPILTSSIVQFADASYHGYLTVQLPAGFNPALTADYDHTEVMATCSDGRVMFGRIDSAAANSFNKFEWAFGTFTVKLRGVDTSGNYGAWSPTSVLAITRPGIPSGPSGFYLVQAAMAVKINWDTPNSWGATWVEVQRSTNGSTVDTTFNSNVNNSRIGEGTFMLDLVIENTPLSGWNSTTGGTPVLPTYYYRIRGVNPDGFGTWSAWAAITVTAPHGSWLVVDSITARELAALTITAGEISANAITAAKLEADLVVATTIRTSSSGTRVELDGPNNRFAAWYLGTLLMTLNADTLRFMNASGTTRTSITPSGIALLSDAGATAWTIARNGSGTSIDMTGPGYQFGAGGSFFNTDQIDQDVVMLTDNGQMDWGRRSVDGVQMPALTSTVDWAVGLQSAYGAVLTNYWKIKSTGMQFDWGTTGTVYAKMIVQTTGLLWALTRNTITDASGNTGAGYGRLGVYAANDLGITAGNEAYVTENFTRSGANVLALNERFLRRATVGSGSANDWVYRQEAWVGAASPRGGLLDLGFEGASAYWALGRASASRDIWYNIGSARTEVTGNFQVSGTLSKTTGSFVIPHPDPAKTATHELRHTFVESPSRGENLYSYVVKFGPRGGSLHVADTEGKPVHDARLVQVENANSPAKFSVTIPLPDYWPWLNDRPRCIPTNSGDGWGRVKARVNDAKTELTVEAEEGGEYTVLLIGTRRDAAAKGWWDRRGAEKTVGQQWTNEGTAALRNTRLANRAAMQNQPATPAPSDSLEK